MSPEPGRVPTDAQILALHRQHAPTPEAFELVYTHCRIVCAIAEQLLRRRAHSLDADLVRAGCLLHDVGVYRLGQDHYLRHGVLGDQLLREAGWPDRLARFCSHHTGVGLSRDDVTTQRLPLPVADYLAETAEEELVMYADKFHSKTTPPVFVSADTYAARVRRFGADKVARFAALRETFGEPDLAPLIDHYGHALV
ncbi:HD domain-containing protein [Cryptosporangium minutisporangium]|uniref:HD domain-containing protein n=1 Tax=Cryptosporangium minutisporangium TaxID=113569 RepID=A0ABP6STV9_9ACTN